jgi:hypothetical protein
MKLRRRTLAKLGLFLLVGAVVNVGVAWGCVHKVNSPPWPPPVSSTDMPAPSAWPIEWREGLPAPTKRTHKRRWLFDEDIVRGGAVRDAVISIQYSVGIPLRSMRWRFTYDMALRAPGGDRWAIVTGAWKLPDHTPLRPKFLPYSASPVGFAANSILFGALLAVATGIAHAIGRAHRRARGLCPRCKYPLADLPTCPECGEALRRKAAAG